MALNYSGVVQLVARQPLELVILVRVQAPEPNLLRLPPTMNTPDLALGAIWYIVFLFSTTCHEAAHALVAKLGGDTTAAEGGQVTLNPIPHIRRSPFGMVVVPILSFLVGGWMIGWASAPFNPAWQRQYPRRSAWMALAGPAANFSLMILAGIAIRIGLAAGYFRAPEFDPGLCQSGVAGECGGSDVSHFGSEYPLHSESASGHVQFAARASAGWPRRDHGGDAGRRRPALHRLGAAFQKLCAARFDHRLDLVRSEFSSPYFSLRCTPCMPGFTTASPRH